MINCMLAANGFSLFKHGKLSRLKWPWAEARDNILLVTLPVVLALIMTGSWLPGWAGALTPPPSFHLQYTPCKNRRVLVFPKDYSLGELMISPNSSTDEEDSLSGAAKGTIVVPAGKFVTFIPAHRFYQNPAIIDTIPPDAVDRLGILAASLADEEDGLCDRALSHIAHLKGVLDLKLDRSDASDEGVAHARDLPNLQKISASQCAFGGKCFKEFAGHKHLRYLRLPSCPIRDENTQYFSALPCLQHLNLCHTSISDEGVRGLADCKSLIELDLSDNPKITDRSIKTLLNLKTLRVLNLAGTSMTNKAALQLKALPLNLFTLPQVILLAKQLQTIRQQMPGILVVARGETARKVDYDTNKLFAPLH